MMEPISRGMYMEERDRGGVQKVILYMNERGRKGVRIRFSHLFCVHRADTIRLHAVVMSMLDTDTPLKPV